MTSLTSLLKLFQAGDSVFIPGRVGGKPRNKLLRIAAGNSPWVTTPSAPAQKCRGIDQRFPDCNSVDNAIHFQEVMFHGTQQAVQNLVLFLGDALHDLTVDLFGDDLEFT